MSIFYDISRVWLSPEGIIALGVTVGLVQQFRTWRHALATAAEVRATTVSVQAVAHDMKALEINTNNKMDMLIKAKDEAAIALIGRAGAEGELRGRAFVGPLTVSLDPATATAAALVLETATQTAKELAAKG